VRSDLGPLVIKSDHMGYIRQPQHRNAAAGENRDIWPFRRGPIWLTSMFVFLDLVNSGIAAVSFERSHQNVHFERGPGPLQFKVFLNRKLQVRGLQDPSKMLFWFPQNWLLQCLNLPNLEGPIWSRKGSNISIFTSCSISDQGLADLADMPSTWNFTP
jgi:hypothetical protein